MGDIVYEKSLYLKVTGIRGNGDSVSVMIDGKEYVNIALNGIYDIPASKTGFNITVNNYMQDITISTVAEAY